MLEGAERIGLALGLTPFVVGVVIVGLGTSFPELVSSFVAVIQNEVEIVAANAIGSNIANILLVVGISAIMGRRLSISKELIDLDLPLLSISTFIFLAAAYDGIINQVESIILFLTFLVYFLYTIKHQDDSVKTVTDVDLLPDKNRDPIDLDGDGELSKAEIAIEKVTNRDIFLLIVGVGMLVLGAKFLIDSVVEISTIFGVATGAVALVAVAIGTSMPELLVSIKAAKRGRSDVVLGNIFGSNAFNLLIVVGLPGIFAGLRLDQPTLMIGLPALIIATILFVISGISRRIHQWEGYMFLLLYLFFIGKLFGFI
jgi:cation:H+ antiporter